MKKILEIIKKHEEIDKDSVVIIDIDRDGNCYYRTLSLYFTNDESYNNFFREQIHLAAKNNKNEFRYFFVSEDTDTVLVNIQLEG